MNLALCSSMSCILRYKLLHYQLEGIDPPEHLFNELKLAESLVQIDLTSKNC